MTQKTYTHNRHTYNGQQLAASMNDNNMTAGNDYIIVLDGDTIYANYRQEQDQFFSPTCKKGDANCIALMIPPSYHWTIWVDYNPNINAAASALGSIRTEKKAKASAENGRLGGGPGRRTAAYKTLQADITIYKFRTICKIIPEIQPAKIAEMIDADWAEPDHADWLKKATSRTIAEWVAANK